MLLNTHNEEQPSPKCLQCRGQETLTSSRGSQSQLHRKITTELSETPVPGGTQTHETRILGNNSDTSIFASSPVTPRLRTSSLEVATPPCPPRPAVVRGKRTGATNAGLKAVLLPRAHAATGLQALPATPVTDVGGPPLISENALRLLLLSKESCSPTHHSHTQHRPQEWE